MATQRWRCIKKAGCFAYNKRFKLGQEFPLEWIDNGYEPPQDWFVRAEDYEDAIRKNEFVGKIVSAGSDPRPTVVLIEELHKYMGDVPKTWNRAQIWRTLIAREIAGAKSHPAESNTVPGPRKPGRPAIQKDS